MTRLRSVPSRLGTVPQRLAPTATGAASGFARTDGRSAAARGYDAAWRRVRLLVLAEQPLCRRCAEAGRTTVATEVHHVHGFTGRDDPARLDPANLEPICTPCHRAETARTATFGRG